MTSPRRHQRSQAADHQRELHQRKDKEDTKEVIEVPGPQNGKKGHHQGQEDAANHQGGEADHQGVAVTLQEGGVNLQDGAVGLGHHGDDAIVISTRGVTLKDRHVKVTQIMSKCFFFSDSYLYITLNVNNYVLYLCRHNLKVAYLTLEVFLPIKLLKLRCILNEFEPVKQSNLKRFESFFDCV